MSRIWILPLLLGLAGCSQVSSPPPLTTSPQPTPLAHVNWHARPIYYIMIDRFDNGNPTNDNGGPGDTEPAQPNNPMGWYGGDFQGIIDRINDGYFNKLGVRALWLSPAYLQGPPQPGPTTNNPEGLLNYPYHGYWPWGFQMPDPHFGRPTTLQELVQDAHAHGLAVILEQVVHDAGYGYPLYTQEESEIASGQLILNNSPSALQTFWFHHISPVNGLCEPYTGPYNPTLDCPLEGLPSFNLANLQVQRLLDASTLYWLNTYGLDGIRLDAALYVPDSFWSQYLSVLRAQDPQLFAFAEVFNGSPSVNGSYTQPQVGFNSTENYPLYFAITQSGLVPNQSPYYGYTNLAAVNYAVEQNLIFDAHPNEMINFIDDQDVPRFTSLLLNNGVPADQVLPRWEIAEVLSYTLPGIPMIYYGDEAGMTGTYDPYQAVAMGEPNNTNRNPMTLWTTAQREAAGVEGYYTWLQTLNKIRSSQPALETGSYTPLFVPSAQDPNVLIYQRGSGTTSLIVAINATSNPVSLTTLVSGGIPETGLPQGPTENLLGGTSPLEVSSCASGTCLTGTLPPWSALLIQ